MAVKYCTEIGPDGFGHARCGPACLAYHFIKAGWESDPFQLTLQLTYDILGVPYDTPLNTFVGLPNGATCQQLITVCGKYGVSASPIMSFTDAMNAAADPTKTVVLLLDNWYIRPRVYPAGSGWDAAHFVAIDGIINEQYAVLNDPLCYIAGEYPLAYQGFTIADTKSLKTAVVATPADWYVGITLR